MRRVKGDSFLYLRTGVACSHELEIFLAKDRSPIESHPNLALVPQDRDGRHNPRPRAYSRAQSQTSPSTDPDLHPPKPTKMQYSKEKPNRIWVYQPTMYYTLQYVFDFVVVKFSY